MEAEDRVAKAELRASKAESQLADTQKKLKVAEARTHDAEVDQKIYKIFKDASVKGAQNVIHDAASAKAYQKLKEHERQLKASNPH